MTSDEEKRRRSKLREARALTIISAAFVLVSLFMLIVGEMLWGVVGFTFFGGCMLVGILQWRGGRDVRDGTNSLRGDFSRLMPLAALLMGVGCLVIFLMAFFAWETFGADTRYSREISLAAGGAGALFFGGGSAALFVVARRKGQQPSPVKET